MKQLIAIAAMVFATAACAQGAKQPEGIIKVPEKVEKKEAVTAPAENNNCVKKDKNGKCPPLPKSPKPTPKKVEPK